MQQEDNRSLSQRQQLHGLTTLLFWGLKDRKRTWMSLLQESLVTPINWWKSVFILCVHVLVGVGMRMKKTGSVVAINYLTQLQLDLFQPTKRLTEMETVVMNCWMRSRYVQRRSFHKCQSNWNSWFVQENSGSLTPLQRKNTCNGVVTFTAKQGHENWPFVTKVAIHEYK